MWRKDMNIPPYTHDMKASFVIIYELAVWEVRSYKKNS